VIAMKRRMMTFAAAVALVVFTTGAEAQTSSTVTMDNYEFMPAEMTVAPGTPVTWTNKQTDDVHSTVSNDGLWDSDTLDTGKSFTFTFTDPGDYAYYCSQHPDMQGVVHVSGD
jgi:plastocyanin